MVSEGKIVDASFFEVFKQRNSKDENKQIKSGTISDSIEKHPHKKAQKDFDTRWTKKGGVSYFGYKNHIKTGNKSELIENYDITPASVHDSQVITSLIDKEHDSGENFYADAAYTGPNQEKTIKDVEMSN